MADPGFKFLGLKKCELQRLHCKRAELSELNGPWDLNPASYSQTVLYCTALITASKPCATSLVKALTEAENHRKLLDLPQVPSASHNPCIPMHAPKSYASNNTGSRQNTVMHPRLCLCMYVCHAALQNFDLKSCDAGSSSRFFIRPGGRPLKLPSGCARQRLPPRNGTRTGPVLTMVT